MTKEAKIGLLLGLAFIVGIAMVLRGVHEPGRETIDETLAISQEIVDEGVSQVPEEIDWAQAVKQFADGWVDTSVEVKPVEAEPTVVMTEEQNNTMNQISEVVESVAAEERAGGNLILAGGERMSGGVGQIYEVKDGDNLSKIALKFYGGEEGNRLLNIKQIFEVNQKTLASMDDLKVGQKLTIPVLKQSGTGRVILPQARQEVLSPEKPKETKSSTRIYVVKEYDSLWEIAERELGKGVRYLEIAKLNEKMLRDENDLWVGMKLKLPVEN